jgi:hypothetical protein
MIPVSPGMGWVSVTWVLGLGAFLGFVTGRLITRLAPRSVGSIPVDAGFGAVGLLVAWLIGVRLGTHARYDGQVLSVRDLVLNYEWAFALVVSVVCVVLGRFLWSRVTGGKAGAA